MKCSGCKHEYTEEEWAALPRAGVQVIPFDETCCDCDAKGAANPELHSTGCTAQGYEMDLRNCTRCRSTFARQYPIGGSPK
jgi:hypothetical protein